MARRLNSTARREVIRPDTPEEPAPHAFLSPESSTIEGASYDPDVEVLTITFRSSPDHPRYWYAGIPKLLWLDFLGATSKGKFFSTRIRPMFSGTRV